MITLHCWVCSWSFIQNLVHFIKLLFAILIIRFFQTVNDGLCNRCQFVPRSSLFYSSSSSFPRKEIPHWCTLQQPYTSKNSCSVFPYFFKNKIWQLLLLMFCQSAWKKQLVASLWSMLIVDLLHYPLFILPSKVREKIQERRSCWCCCMIYCFFIN